ncbi:MAG: copper amine oxidase N-terminal domain-containing protein [Bacillota bacterium]
MRKGVLTALLAGAVLLLAAALSWPAPTQAATLSGGSYTYVIDGEEVAFTYDPIVKKEGVLLPLELFTHLGASVEGALERTVSLKFGPVPAQVTLGRRAATLDGEAVQLSVAPVRLSGRLFLPADLLEGFGLSFEQEGNYVTISRYVSAMPALTRLTEGAWRSLLTGRAVSGSVKADSGIYLEARFTLLNQAMLTDQNLAVAYGTRARLLGLLETHSLLLVELSNRSLKSGALATAGIYLVDQHRNQYEVAEVVDLGDGMVSARLAPGADRMGVLLLPRLAEGAGPVKLYYEPNGAFLGQFVSGR